jgi:phosphoribosyl 1,2-cyclic phosphodiesterase
MLELVFVGTGGGRFAMITQRIRTGGLRILSDNLNLHVDPGPGALVYSLEMGLDPQKLDAILVSHSHLDHTNDLGVLIEAMTDGATKKKGMLAAAHSVLNGNDVCDKAISNYHKGLHDKIVDATPGTTFTAGEVKIKVCKAVHSDPDAVGFRFETETFGEFAYIPDLEYFEEVSDFYGGVRLLILSVLRPSGKPWKGHMSTEEAARVISEVRPEKALITHFGMLMVFKGPNREATLIERRAGIPTIAAKDGMHLTLGDAIQVGEPKNQADLSSFMSSP